MQIFTYPKSRSLKILWVLEEIDTPYQATPVDLLDPHSHRRSPHPQAKVPYLIDGEFSLSESLAIGLYLCEKFSSSLYPPCPKQRALIMQWLSVCLTELEPPLFNLLKQLLFTPETKRNSALIDEFTATALQVINQLNVVPNQAWLAGEQFSLADIFFTQPLHWATVAGIPLPEALQNYLERATARPAYQRAVAKNNIC